MHFSSRRSTATEKYITLLKRQSPMSQTHVTPPVKAYLTLLAVVFAAAVTPIFIRNAQQEGVPSLYMIVVRLVLVSLVLTPIVVRRHRPELANLGRRNWLLGIGSGFFLALNLLCLFVALEYTSVLVTSVLRRTSSLWVLGLEILFLGAVFTPRIWGGLLLAFAGSLMAGFGGSAALEAGQNPILGAGLALFGAFCMSCYLLIGRKLSWQLPPTAYSWLVFSGAAVVTMIFMLFTQTPISGFSAMGYFWIIMVTIVAQVIGHMSMNVALGYFPATHVGVALLVSVAVSTVLALILFNEVPSALQIIGSLVIVIGVLLVSKP